MSKTYSIRKARPGDAGQILKLMKELANYDKTPEDVRIGEKELAENLSTWYHCIVLECKGAEDEKREIIGYSLWSYCFGWRGKMAYLEDIYVIPNHRGNGLGYSLIQCVAKMVHDKECDRLRFSVLAWNELAKRMYRKINALNVTETGQWEMMHLDGDDLKKLARTIPMISFSD